MQVDQGGLAARGRVASFSRHATLDWSGDVPRGAGAVAAGGEAFQVPVTFPRLAGEPAGTTTPEELLAAAHAACFGIGLRSVLAQRGGTARRIRVTATISAEKGSGRILIRSSQLRAEVEGLDGLHPDALADAARAAEEGCTISAVLRETVRIGVEVSAT